MSDKGSGYRPYAALEAAIKGPLFRRWVTLAGGVCLTHAAVAAFIGLEADSSGEVLIMSLIAAVLIGLFMGGTDYNLAATVVAAGGPPAVWAKWHWYWKADMHSPAGAAQAFVEWLFAWTPPPPAHYALAGFLGAAGAIAWLFARVNKLWEKKTGRPLISLDE